VPTAVCWLRRDLRLHDHRALRAACAEADAVVPLFVLDPALVRGARVSRARLVYLSDALADLDARLRRRGGRLVVRHGDPAEVVPALAAEVGADTVHWHRDATPYAATREARVTAALDREGIAHREHDGVVIQPPGSVLTKGGAPFKVYTPFARAWRAQGVAPPAAEPGRVAVPDAVASAALPAPADLGASEADRALPGGEGPGLERLERFLDGPIEVYDRSRDLLATDGTSRLSADLHYGTVSPRQVWAGLAEADAHRAFADELIFREFYHHVLAAWPETAATEWSARFRDLPWGGPGPELDAWAAGRTGYPIVDAGMRQLAATSWMHNRARMIVASFLCKDLLIDWRHGEAHFLRHLVDGDIASNNGGWQWAAGTGTDAQPYFRIFNPVRQGERFDPDGAYVRRWVPELAEVPTRWVHAPWTLGPLEQQAAGCVLGRDYPEPIVDHAAARQRALDWFATHARD